MQRKNLKYLIPIVLVAMVFVGFRNHFAVDEHKRDKVILELIYQVITRSHFAPKEINDEFSSEVFDGFIESMDYNKRFLLAKDVADLEQYRYKLDDQIKASQLEFFEDGYARIQKRMKNAAGFYEEILSKPFRFDAEATIETDPEKMAFAKDEKALRDRWEAYLKFRVLNRVYDEMEAAEKEDSSSTEKSTKTFAEIEKEAREKELETHREWFKNMEDLERIDWVGMYMNAITNTFDPHTEYFPPQRQEDFEIEMSGQLEGIGAQLAQRGDYITVEKIVSGSASWRQGELEEGDKILAVAQDKAEPVDVVGMSIRKAVKLIRGKKGTAVVLTVRKKDNTKRDIRIIRDIVELEATFAKSAVLGAGNDKIGLIRLPKFYVDFYDQSNRNCADDVRDEVLKLKAEGVKGIVLDLRGNGGGSLQAVVDIVGHFVDKGPVVQVKTAGQAAKVLSSSPSSPVWSGPLVVMVNQFSASASEIFAAAIQDYNRGIIIGSKSTFGKGTVQNVFDMDRAVNWSYNDLKPLGAMKVTIQKYYRINGGTPQLKGVEPDIVLPDNYNYIPFGEREQKNALPYNEIEPAAYKVWPNMGMRYQGAVALSNQRIGQNSRFKEIDAYAKWLKENRDRSVMSLNYAAFAAYQKELKAKADAFKKLGEADEKLPIALLAAQKTEATADSLKAKEYDQWHKALEKDLYVREAFQVAQDLR